MKEHNDYLLVNVSENFDDLKRIALPEGNYFDKIAWEQFFHQLPQDQLEVFVLTYLGFELKDIKRILGFKKLAHVYYINVKLKRLFRKNIQLLN